MEKMRQKIQHALYNPRTWIITFIGFVFIVVVVTIINLSIHRNYYGPQLAIKDFKSLVPDISDERRQAIESNLYTQAVTQGADEQDVSKANGVIRESHIDITYDSETNIHEGEFIVDIPEITQSYLIQYFWAPDEENNIYFPINSPFLIKCLPKSLQIYSDFNCNVLDTTPQDSSPKSQLINNTPYTLHFNEETNAANIYGLYYQDGSQYVQVDIDSCGDKSLMDAAQRATEEWLASIGIPEDYFTIYVRDLCNGAAQ